jgi:hypothetical protein
VEESTTPSPSRSRDNNHGDPLDNDPPIDLFPNPQAPFYEDDVEEVQIDTTSTKRPLLFDDKAYDDKPVATTLPSKRI